MPLLRQDQRDYAAGMFRSTEPFLIPQNGAYDLLNYLLDVDGVAYRRGGVLEVSDAFGNDGLTFVWDGHLQGGQRTVLAHGTRFGVVDTDGESVIDIGGAGLDRPTPAHAIGGELIWDGGVTYAGSRKTQYWTGKVAVTQGSPIVIGTGTTWNTLVDNGMYFTPDGGRSYRVQSIDSVTQLTLAEPYAGPSGSDKFYMLSPLAQAARIAPIYSVVTKRLLALDHDRVYFSAYDQPRVFSDDDYHQIPGGAEILGGSDAGDSALIFTSDGIWQISNMDLDEIDDFGNVQQRVDKIDPMVLWHKEGLAKWNERLIVPALDGVWMLGQGRLDISIAHLYQDYVDSGYRLGLATVYRAHYFLPILDSANGLVDLLVCRLDRKVRTRLGDIYPWTHFDGLGATARAFTQQVVAGEAARLLMAGPSPHILQPHYFDPNANVADDLGTNFKDQIITRDYPTGDGNQNVSRWVQLDYEMWDTQENNNPTITGAFSTGERDSEVIDWGQFNWGGGDWASPDLAEWTTLGTAPEEVDGLLRKKWAIVGPNGAPRSRYIAFRLRSSGRVAKLIVRGISLWTRQSTKAD